jgi:hypothetical protein
MQDDTRQKIRDAATALAAALDAVDTARKMWFRDSQAGKVDGNGFPISDRFTLSPVGGAAEVAEIRKMVG